MGKLFEKFARTRNLEGDVMQTELKRCLSTFDLVLIGIGSMVGSGMYVLAGEIAHEITGPALFLAFLVAGVASGLSAWCYAEFGARVPKAGSAYVYTYLTIGELAAFVIGWNLILEHVIGSAAIVRGLIGYINAITDNWVNNAIPDALLEKDWDPYVVILIVLLALVICYGIKETAWLNNILTGINLSVALMIIVFGFFYADLDNWSNFLPNGVSSIFEGAAQSYFAFVGYDTITIASEEALTPSFSIPVALASVVVLVGLLYCSVSISLTLLVPYTQISNDSAFASAFKYLDISWAEYTISVGAIAAMVCALLGIMFTMPRCIYAMSSDGIIFTFLSRVNPKTQVPVLATIIGSVGVCVFAFFFTLQELAEFMSIGTLLAYALIALAIIILRYHPTDLISGETGSSAGEESPLVEKIVWKKSQSIVVSLFVVFTLLTVSFIAFAQISETQAGAITCSVFAGLFAVVMMGSLVYLSLISKENNFSVRWKVPFVPFFPGLSVFVNLYLMTQLNVWTWVRFVCWMAAGFLLYFVYGVKNSNLERLAEENEQPTAESENA